MSQTKDLKTIKTADLMTELETIVAWFENEQVDVDAALAKFERGALLAKELKGRLKEAENKVVKIQASFKAED